MTTGRYGGSGTYSFRSRSEGIQHVQVSHMPEDNFNVRAAFTTRGETNGQLLLINDQQAQLLWLALNDMAVDLKWKEPTI